MDGYCESWMDVLAGRHNVTDVYLEHVWIGADGVHEHVVFETNHRRVYLVVVCDVEAGRVAGHHLLDINETYGLPSPLTDLGLT